MKLSILQFSPVLADKQTNFETISRLLEQTTADIIVLPELCTTGYFFLSQEEIAPLAEYPDGEFASLLREYSRKKNAIIVAGFAEKDHHTVYNSSILISPTSDKSIIYRKTHLFYRERFVFSEGDTGFFVTEIPEFDLRLGMMICYDWRFPEAARSLGLLGADIIACPSNLVTDVWHLAMPVRALENKVYVATANRTGSEVREIEGVPEELVFKGRSAIYGYNGQSLCEASDTQEHIIESEIIPNLTREKSFNSINDIFADRRPNMYKL